MQRDVMLSRSGTLRARRPSAESKAQRWPNPPEDDGDGVHVHVAVVRRKTERAFQLMLSKGFWDHPVAIWVPRKVMEGQGLDLGQRDRMVRIPKWLWERIVQEVRNHY